MSYIEKYNENLNSWIKYYYYLDNNNLYSCIKDGFNKITKSTVELSKDKSIIKICNENEFNIIFENKEIKFRALNSEDLQFWIKSFKCDNWIFDEVEISFNETNLEEKKEYIYLIREREFIRLNLYTYKIGRTKQEPNVRLRAYPKNSEVILLREVTDCIYIEKLIKNKFKELFNQEDYGTEYFTGNKYEMIEIINQIIKDVDKNMTDSIDSSSVTDSIDSSSVTDSDENVEIKQVIEAKEYYIKEMKQLYSDLDNIIIHNRIKLGAYVIDNIPNPIHR